MMLSSSGIYEGKYRRNGLAPGGAFAYTIIRKRTAVTIQGAKVLNSYESIRSPQQYRQYRAFGPPEKIPDRAAAS